MRSTASTHPSPGSRLAGSPTCRSCQPGTAEPPTNPALHLPGTGAPAEMRGQEAKQKQQQKKNQKKKRKNPSCQQSWRLCRFREAVPVQCSRDSRRRRQQVPVPTPFPLRPWEKASGSRGEAEPPVPRDAAAPRDAAEPALPLSHPDSASLAPLVAWRAARLPNPTGALTMSVPQPRTGNTRGQVSGCHPAPATPAQLRREDARLEAAGSMEPDVSIIGHLQITTRCVFCLKNEIRAATGDAAGLPPSSGARLATTAHRPATRPAPRSRLPSSFYFLALLGKKKKKKAPQNTRFRGTPVTGAHWSPAAAQHRNPGAVMAPMRPVAGFNIKTNSQASKKGSGFCKQAAVLLHL